MAVWSPENIIVTDKGKEVLSKVQAGVGKLTVSRIVTGGGYVTPSQLHNQTEVSLEKQIAQVTGVNTGTEGSSIEVRVTNGELEASYDLYQIGVYVTHPDFQGDVLYLLAQCDTDSPDTVPTASETPVTLSFSLYMAHSGASDVVIEVNQADVVSQEKFNALKEQVTEHISDTVIHITDEERSLFSDKYTRQEVDAFLEMLQDAIDSATDKADSALSGKVDIDLSNMDIAAFRRAVAQSIAKGVSTESGNSLNEAGLRVSPVGGEFNTTADGSGFSIVQKDSGKKMIEVAGDTVNLDSADVSSSLTLDGTVRVESYENDGKARLGFFWIRGE